MMTRFFALLALIALCGHAVLAAPMQARGTPSFEGVHGKMSVVQYFNNGDVYKHLAGVDTELNVNSKNTAFTLRELSAYDGEQARVLVLSAAKTCLTANKASGKSKIILDTCYTSSALKGADLDGLKARQSWFARPTGKNDVSLQSAASTIKGHSARPLVSVKKSTGNVHLNADLSEAGALLQLRV